MISFLRFVIPLFVLTPTLLVASSEQCTPVLDQPDFKIGPYPPIPPYAPNQNDYTSCSCGVGLKTIHIPKQLQRVGFKPVAACGISDEYGSSEEYGASRGSYYFKGNVIVTGLLIREDDVIARFDLNSDVAIDRLKFDFTSPYTIKRLRPPEPSTAKPCWKTKATLRIKTLVQLNGGTDEAGLWPMQYDVLSLGEYKKCN